MTRRRSPNSFCLICGVGYANNVHLGRHVQREHDLPFRDYVWFRVEGHVNPPVCAAEGCDKPRTYNGGRYSEFCGKVAELNRGRALDLFCCAGGAAMGLYRAGFDVVGVDIQPQPRYPFTFHLADAMTFPLDGFDFLWASPPCQRFSRLNTREDLSHYPDLIEPIRRRFLASGRPFVIENVPEAPVRCDLMLCGAMFGLRSYRHRHFECSFAIDQPDHPRHRARVNRRGENRRAHWANGGFITVTGDVGTYCGLGAMGIDWMTGNEMSEAIPPAYSEYIARRIDEAPRQPSLAFTDQQGA